MANSYEGESGITKMSNPVTNAEVEDVLSSIRRLVSTDTRPVRSKPEEVAKIEEETSLPGADRLVLTPALRVAAEQDNTPVHDADREDGDVRDEQDDALNAVGPALQPDERHLQDETEAKAQDAESDSAEIINETKPALNEPSGKIDPEELRFLFRAHSRQQSDIETTDELSGPAKAGEEMEGDGDNAETAGESDTDTGAPLLLTDPKPDSAENDDEPADGESDQLIAADQDAEVAEEEPRNARADAGVPRELTAKIAALEAVVAQTPEQWEPDDEDVDDYAGTSVSSLDWEDDVDLDGSGAPLRKDQVGQVTQVATVILNAEAQQLADDEPGGGDPDSSNQQDGIDEDEIADLAGADVTVDEPADEVTTETQHDLDEPGSDDTPVVEAAGIDKEALRELVAEIVRQELQGSLGERITLNVRKLVRRELQRALAAEELE